MPTKKPPRTSAQPRSTEEEDVLSLEEAIAFLKTTKPTMYRWISQGKLQGFRAGRQWRFYRRALRKFLEYTDPMAAKIDLAAVRAAIKLLDERIARAEQARQKGARR